MARLGPWDSARQVAVAVSGGPDSLALALLAQGWGRPTALIVDHGLRPGSAAEADSARAALYARGMPARVLRLQGVLPGPGLPARARAARYAALAAACRAAGLVDLLLGHHAGDQAETVLMRQRAGSGPAGCAGMAACTEGDDIRLLRPLLAIPPARLRAVVQQAGLVAAEDPTNTDLRYTRALLRQEIGSDRSALLASARAAARLRMEAERASTAELSARVSLFPEGYAVVSPGNLRADSASALFRTISGRRFPVRHDGVLRAATRAGVRVLPAGRLGPGWLVVREAAAVAGPVAASPDAVWDGRFRVVLATGDTVSALGQLGAGLPRAVLAVLPAFWQAGRLSYAPHLGYDTQTAVSPAVMPVAGAGFLP